MTTIVITVGACEFSFLNFNDWVNAAKFRFSEAKLSSDRAICVDGKGRICTCGKEFMRARDEDAFPVFVYRKVIE